MRQKKYILALILLLYPLRHAAIGLDLMDAGYALGNYKFFDTMNETWKIATYLSNVIGMLLMKLPFGDNWIGMNIYTGLLIGITASATYLTLINLIPNAKEKELLLFLSEIVALSVGIAPSVVLYHYLGYIFMTAASMILYVAIVKDSIRHFIISGVILGICVAVRMPNITYMAFIIPLWYYCIINRKQDSKWFGKLVNKTFYCICGYLLGIIIPIGYIEIRYGISSYPDMVISLLGMTQTATDYKPTSMLLTIFGEYIKYCGWLLLFVFYIIAGVIFFWTLKKLVRVKSELIYKITYVFKTAYCVGLLVLLRFCYGRGMFGIDYTDSFSMYKWMAVYLLIVILLCIWVVISKKTGNDIKLWSAFVLVIIFVTPLGSNNGLITIINNLFLVAPLSVLMIGEFYINVVDRFSEDTRFAVKAVINFFMLCILIVSLLFGIDYVFHDEPVGERKRVSVNFKCDTVANGILTTLDKKENLESLDDYLYENELNEKSLITYGYIPALSYIFDMEPAVYTTWLDLDSNPISRLETELDELSSLQIEDMPVVILGSEYVDELLENEYPKLAYAKLKVIEKYMEENNYTKVYENSTYRVYNIIISKQ